MGAHVVGPNGGPHCGLVLLGLLHVRRKVGRVGEFWFARWADDGAIRRRRGRGTFPHGFHRKRHAVIRVCREDARSIDLAEHARLGVGAPGLEKDDGALVRGAEAERARLAVWQRSRVHQMRRDVRQGGLVVREHRRADGAGSAADLLLFGKCRRGAPTRGWRPRTSRIV